MTVLKHVLHRIGYILVTQVANQPDLLQRFLDIHHLLQVGQGEAEADEEVDLLPGELDAHLLVLLPLQQVDHSSHSLRREVRQKKDLIGACCGDGSEERAEEGEKSAWSLNPLAITTHQGHIWPLGGKAVPHAGEKLVHTRVLSLEQHISDHSAKSTFDN